MINSNLTKLIIILGLVLACILMLRENSETKIKTITKTEIIQVSDNKVDTKPITTKIHTIKVPVYVTNVVNKVDTVYKDVKTKKYTFRDTLKNGVIESTIFSDMIHKRDVKLTTFDNHTTTTITKIQAKSNMFIGASINTNFNTNISQASLNLYYVHKDKFIIGAGLGNDFVSNKPISNLTFAIKF